MSSSPFEVPTIESLAALLPNYQFEHLIARGGMGVVYKAHQISLDRDVAFKVLPREFGKDSLFRDCFAAEAKAMARLRHNNLISVYDFGDVDGLLYIVMEYVPGKTLHHSAHGKAIDPKQAVEIIMAACEGIHHAHENGIIHRDFKPGNILLTPEREPKIGDFGLALSTGSNGLPMGSPGYMAPELVKCAKTGSVQSDIYAIGAVLRELLTGVPAESENAEEAKVSDAKLAAVCCKATHAEAAQRHTSARDLMEDLKSWLNAKPIATATPETSSWKPPGKVSLNLTGKITVKPAMMTGSNVSVKQTTTLSAKPTARVSLRSTAQVTVKAALRPTAQVTVKTALKPTTLVTVKAAHKPTAQVTVKSALRSTAQITVNSALKPTALVTVNAAARPTALVTVKAAGNQEWKPAERNGTRPRVVMSHEPQGSSMLRNCATIAVLLATIYFLWGFYKTKQANIARQQSELLYEEAEKLTSVKALPADFTEASTLDYSKNHGGNKYDRAFVESIAETNRN